MNLPGWDSLSAVRRIHDAAEIIGIVLFGIVVLAELCQYVYGRRDRHLTAVAETENLKKTKAATNALQAEITPRSLSNDQKGRLISALLPYRGQRVCILRIMGDTEAEPLANDLMEVLKAASWQGFTGGSPGWAQTVFDVDPIGIVVVANQEQVAAHQVPEAVVTLVKTLHSLNLTSLDIYGDSTVPTDAITIRVGRNPLINR